MQRKKLLLTVVHILYQSLIFEYASTTSSMLSGKAVTYTVQNYDILKAETAGWLGGLLDDSKNKSDHQNVYSDGKRLKDDKTDLRLYDEQWEIAKHYPFVEKDAQKRTCSKALVMTHAYSNAIMDKVVEALKNGIVGNEDDDW